jgi:branched-subunit amino acid transport protein
LDATLGCRNGSFAALGALIFPGILTVIDDKPWIGPVSGACAAIVALKARNAIFPVLVGIAAAVGLDAIAR